MCEEKLQMPPMVYLEDYGGNFALYFDAIYEVFKQDFVDSTPICRGLRVATKKYPLESGKEHTFYHITHDGGESEEDRLPNFRRMERIRFPRFLIDNIEHPYLKVWENQRGGSTRILIYHPDEKYLVVLKKLQNYLLLWTAYLVDHSHQERKLLKEYEAYIKAKTA